jgi:hypothetical protein
MARSLLRFFGAAAAVVTLAAATPSRVYSNETLHLHAFEPPPGWEKSPPPTYPRLLATYTHPEGGRLALTVQRVAPGTTAAQLAEQSKTPLAHQGFSDPHVVSDGDRVTLRATLASRLLLSGFVVHQSNGFVVTLVADKSRAAALAHDLDESLRSLVFTEPDTDDNVQR